MKIVLTTLVSITALSIGLYVGSSSLEYRAETYQPQPSPTCQPPKNQLANSLAFCIEQYPNPDFIKVHFSREITTERLDSYSDNLHPLFKKVLAADGVGDETHIERYEVVTNYAPLFGKDVVARNIAVAVRDVVAPDAELVEVKPKN